MPRSEKSTTSDKTVATAEARHYYRLGVQYKDGNGVDMDYAKAFEYFDKAAALGHLQSRYAKAYLLYKGLGCTQDYVAAAALFRDGALAGKDNSMYFYALCFRNGYGIAQNKDSAKYWLDRAAALGYDQAVRELAMNGPENRADSARELLQTIYNLALPAQAPPNTFVRIPSRMPSREVAAGRYTGFLIQYDWSGQNVIDTREMTFDLSCEGARATGEWVEAGRDSFRFSGWLRGDSLVFEPVIHGRKDHYSPDSAIPYRLKNAALSIVQSTDIVYLAGNVSMFSPQRGEPSKPVVLALSRTMDEKAIKTKFLFDRVYPNPFRDVLDIDFSIGKTAMVSMTMVNAAGQQVYLRPGQLLTSGSYAYRIQLPAGMSPGMYFLQVNVDGKMYSYKLMHI
ncbi:MULTISPECIES: T9SS type A sorting domain-containing protein [Chitinophagaceae]